MTESEDVKQGEVQSPQQKEIIFQTDDTFSAYTQAITWLDAFKPSQVTLAHGRTVEGLEIVRVVFIR